MMYTLYHHFLQKVKEQQVQRYNDKHRAYLIRAGKITTNDNKFQKRRNNFQTNQNRNDNRRQTYNNVQETQPIIANQNQIKINEAKPRRQRQFNRPGRNQKETTPVQNQFAGTQNNSNIIVQSKKFENRKQQRNINNISQVQIQNKSEFRQMDRPIKQSKLTLEQIQYLNQQNRGKNQIFVPKQKQRPINKQKAPQQPSQQPSQFQEVQLIECGICGRKFKQEALQKHEKICQKVFQQKRKPFQAKKTDEQAQLLKKNEKNEPQTQKQAKWKKQSQVFRNNLKKARGQKVQVVEQDDRIQCPGCGRKFNEKAAQKHIQFCTKKAKR